MKIQKHRQTTKAIQNCLPQVQHRQLRIALDIEPVEKGRNYILQFFLSSNSGV